MLRYAGEEVFADELRVTYAPDCSPARDVADWCVTHGAEVGRGQVPAGVQNLYWEGGRVGIEERGRFALVELTGKALGAVRGLGKLGELLMLLGSEPHRVSRLDVACDFRADAPRVVRGLVRRHPVEFSLGRKSVPTWCQLEADRFGQVTGSWYVGRRAKSRVQARVYDKADEAWKVRGEELPPTARVEIECSRHVGATLRDVALPDRLFWHYASGLIWPPKGVEEWFPGDSSWTSAVRPALDAERLRRRVEESGELKAFASMAAALGPVGHGLVRSWVLAAYDAAQVFPSVTSQGDSREVETRKLVH